MLVALKDVSRPRNISTVSSSFLLQLTIRSSKCEPRVIKCVALNFTNEISVPSSIVTGALV